MTRANSLFAIALGAALAAAAPLWISCGGGPPRAAGHGAGPGAAPDDGAQGPEAERRAAAEARLAARQEAACERVAPAITACAVESARREMSPAELAELDLEKTTPLHEKEFFRKCAASRMSQRQIEVYERCMADTRCEVFLPCLDAARPQPPAP